MRLDELVGLWGTPQGAAFLEGDRPFDGVCTDSRTLQPGSLFLPLVGEHHDGHRFLTAALSGGAAAALAQGDRLPAEEAEALAQRWGRPIWLVPDSQAAYQELARAWRRQLQAPVVAVTGSAGKTTTRELIRAALAPLGPVLASVGNENNDVGVPLTLLRAAPEHRAVVVEMGMRGLGEIERLSRCAEPDVAVITNIGTAHIGRLGSREAIGQAKCEITARLRPGGLLVIPAGDPLLEASLAPVWRGEVVRVALAGDRLPAALPAADWTGRLEPDGEAGNGLFRIRVGDYSLPLPLEGEHNARNLLLALAVARHLGVSPHALEALALDLPGGRSRRLQLGTLTVLDETYNASPEAMAAALRLLAGQRGRRFAVLGTMLELGERSVELHRSIGALARELGLDGLVVVDAGAEGEAMAGAAGLPQLERVPCPELAAEPLARWLRPGDSLLLKASRGVALERLIPLLPSL